MTTNAVNESYLLIDELEETLASGNARDRGLMLARVADLFVAGAFRYSDRQIGAGIAATFKMALDFQEAHAEYLNRR